MDFSAVAAISSSGMEVERARLDASALNLANVHTSRTAEGGPFKPLRVVSGPAGAFQHAFAHAGGLLPGAQIVGIERASLPPRLVHEPGHPDADARGFVAYPAIDGVTEMVNIMTAVRAYEANLAALNAAKAMANKALDIGGAA